MTAVADGEYMTIGSTPASPEYLQVEESSNVRVVDVVLQKRASGLGFTVAAASGGVVVYDVTDGPEGACPVRPGDKLLFINNIDVRGWALNDVVSLLRSVVPGALPVSVARTGPLTQDELISQNNNNTIMSTMQPIASPAGVYDNLPFQASSPAPASTTTTADAAAGGLMGTLNTWRASAYSRTAAAPTVSSPTHDNSNLQLARRHTHAAVGRIGRAAGVGKIMGVVLDINAPLTGWMLGGGEMGPDGTTPKPCHIVGVDPSSPAGRAIPAFRLGDVIVAIDGRNVSHLGQAGVHKVVEAAGYGPLHVVIQRESASAPVAADPNGVLFAGDGVRTTASAFAQEKMVETDRYPLGIAATASNNGPCAIVRVDAGTAADQAGIEAGQVLVAVNGRELRGLSQGALDALLTGLKQPAIVTVGHGAAAGTASSSSAAAVPSITTSTTTAASATSTTAVANDTIAPLIRTNTLSSNPVVAPAAAAAPAPPTAQQQQTLDVTIIKAGGSYGMKLMESLPGQLEIQGVFVQSTVADGAAEASGVMASDRIVAIDGVSLAGMTYRQGLEMIKKTSSMTCTITRAAPVAETALGTATASTVAGIEGMPPAPPAPEEAVAGTLAAAPEERGMETDGSDGSARPRMGSFAMPSAPPTIAEDAPVAPAAAAAADSTAVTMRRRSGSVNMRAPRYRASTIFTPFEVSLSKGEKGFAFGVICDVPGQVYVGRVLEGGPALVAGMATGDRILEINGQSVSGSDEVPAYSREDCVKVIKGCTELTMSLVRPDDAHRPQPPSEWNNNNNVAAAAPAASAAEDGGGDGIKSRLLAQFSAVDIVDDRFVCMPLEGDAALTDDDYNVSFSVMNLHDMLVGERVFDRSEPMYCEWSEMLNFLAVGEDGLVSVYNLIDAFQQTELTQTAAADNSTSAVAAAATQEEEEEIHFDVVDVKIVRDKRGLGFGIVGGDVDGESINVASISPQGPAHGVLMSGDRILWANGVAIEGLKRGDAVRVLKSASEEARLLVARASNGSEEAVNSLVFVSTEFNKRSTGFGVNIIGGSETSWKHVYISKITPGGAADDTGVLAVRDRVIALNDVSFVDVLHDDAVKAFKKAKKKVQLLVQREQN